MSRRCTRAQPIAFLATLSTLALLATGAPAERAVTSAARLGSGDTASEYWDFTARFDSEHRLFARFMITNEGPGEHSAVALGHVVSPDGRVFRFRNARDEGRWELSEDRLRIRIGSSILDQSGPLPKLEVDSNKQKVKIHLFFEPTGAPPAPAAGGVPGTGFELIDSGAPVHGTLQMGDMELPVSVTGTMAATHAWTSESESRFSLRRIEFFSLADQLAIYLVDVMAPAGERTRWLVVEREGEVLHSSDRFDLDLDTPRSRGDDYPLPTKLRFSSDGLAGEVTLGRVVLEHDPLELLPQPFRFLLSFKSRPHRVWTDSPFEVTVQGGTDRAPLHFRGTGITNVTFLNPVPDQPGA